MPTLAGKSSGAPDDDLGVTLGRDAHELVLPVDGDDEGAVRCAREAVRAAKRVAIRSRDGRYRAEAVRIASSARINSTLALRDAAKAGLGIADLPRYLIEEELATRKLLPVIERFSSIEHGVYVIYAAGPLLPKRVKEAASRLVRQLSKDLA